MKCFTHKKIEIQKKYFNFKKYFLNDKIGKNKDNLYCYLKIDNYLYAFIFFSFLNHYFSYTGFSNITFIKHKLVIFDVLSKLFLGLKFVPITRCEKHFVD